MATVFSRQGREKRPRCIIERFWCELRGRDQKEDLENTLPVGGKPGESQGRRMSKEVGSGLLCQCCASCSKRRREKCLLDLGTFCGMGGQKPIRVRGWMGTMEVETRGTDDPYSWDCYQCSWWRFLHRPWTLETKFPQINAERCFTLGKWRALTK